MSFTPASPITFNFVQFQNTASQTVYHQNNGPFNGDSIQVLGLPLWLQATNIYADNTTNRIYFTLSVNETYAANMSDGDYNASLTLKLQIGAFPLNYGPYQVFLNVTEVTPLSLAPTTLPFNFTIGGNTPQNQTLNISSESNWSIVASQAWVTLSQTVGVNSGQVFVGVDPSGLTTGQYSAILTVTDNTQVPRSATVTLNVSDGNTEVDFLYASPQNIEFVSELAVENTTVKALLVESSGNWSATVSEDWLNISVNSGNTGITQIDVSVDSINLTDLDVPYLAQIVITQAGLQRTVFVQLFLLEFLQDGITSETLYFADDRNKLQVTNVAPNMFLYLEGVLNNGIQNLIYKLNAPYQNGLAKVLFGLETNVMLQSVVPTNNFSTRIKNNISPVNINFTAYNKQLNTGATIPLESYANVRFLTGKTPELDNRLSYIPTQVHLTADAVLSLSTLSDEAITEISITGDVTATLNTSIAENLYVYNAVVNLADFNLSVGQNISITFGAVVVNVTIKPKGLEQTIVAFENEWKEHEFFEFTGELKIEDQAKATETQIQVEGNEQTKIVSIDASKDYTLNTGNIYSEPEINWLSKMLTAKRVFIYRESTPVEIVLTSKKLQTYKTRTAFNAFRLQFKKAITE